MFIKAQMGRTKAEGGGVGDTGVVTVFVLPLRHVESKVTGSLPFFL